MGLGRLFARGWEVKQGKKRLMPRAGLFTFSRSWATLGNLPGTAGDPRTGMRKQLEQGCEWTAPIDLVLDDT